MSLPLVLTLVATALVGVWVAVTYNRLVGLRLACESSWAQIDVALRLRHDLVPRLAETVAGYAGHERRTFEEVTRARSSAVAEADASLASRGTAEAALGLGIGSVMLLAEEYPDLLASENFARLADELARVEEKISITRRVYNDTVETYNTQIQVFPPVIVAALFRFRPREFFDAPIEAESVPRVAV